MKISGGRIRDGRFERVEPRCHICREEKVRVRVNELLDWHGVPVAAGRGGRVSAVSYADIVQVVNEGRKETDLITLASLRAHAKRHYDFAGIAAYWAAQMDEQLTSFLDGLRGPKPTY
ncbi:hypothetical protein [Mycobacterium sp. 1245852.3]|uniref:hypothetical protein n=1 Tax=Mycobacterium sp. 1245852.3 TaxID=1856860 RepID=UPI0012E99FED|nr:hypothetical protein [Mycobacterium sp. 1245852.3]